MMKYVLTLVLATLLFHQNLSLESKILKTQTANKSPCDLRDEAKALIDELNQLILGSILVAEVHFSDLSAEIMADAVNAQLNTEVDINQEYLSIEEQLTSIKNLAQAAGKNISSCLAGSEDRLNSLPDIYIYKTDECVTETRQNAESMLDAAAIRVETTITSVQNLYYQLDECTTDDCIEILFILIDYAAEGLPSRINNQVTKADEDSPVVKAKIQECSNLNVSGFVYEENSILAQIADCVNVLIPT